MMTVHEVAEYLRIKERKIYDLVAQKQIPCTRVMGKWLFPRHLIDLWLMQNSESNLNAHYAQQVPEVVVGSHDPLLEWALRESRHPLAVQATGSLEGLSRFGLGEAILCGMHVLDVDSGQYNVPLIKSTLKSQDIVVIEWAWRQQGLVVAPGNPLAVGSLADLAGKKARLIDRQEGAGSRVLLDYLLAGKNIDRSDLNIVNKLARTELDVGLTIAGGKADAGIAVASVARQLHLDFIPLATERFDLVMRRRDYFEPPIQALFALSRSAAFIEKAEELSGYDIRGLGNIIFNM
ncbi:MAG: helix-turn-helix transcriptional regulator [Methylobacter sp.]|uniref:helix-turn-helix transcriptional regulator n=1 Tax=Methylobacter sp. TaxID=2051955 RepID=UPI00258E2D92|nr:helix-turn-helix transcriptional regulator [Methylobacter sp.]MCL7422050.1 helix-turn-helix transcriptional regulator [Methylobacter sp.]